MIRKWYTDRKRAKDTGKMELKDLPDAGLIQTLTWWKMQCLQQVIMEVCLYT